MKIGIRVTPEADGQIAELDGWWRRHRTSAADQVTRELGRLWAALEDTPVMGRRVHPA